MRTLGRGLLTTTVLATSMLLLSGCFLAPITITNADDGTVQTIEVGSTLIVVLEGNSSTGHQWIRSEPASLNGDPLDALSEGTYKADDPGVCGGPGTFTFQYEATTPGVVTLTYEHRRPWEDEVIETVSFIIWVK